MDKDQLLEDVLEMLAKGGGEVVVHDSYTELQFGMDPERPKQGVVVIFVQRDDEEEEDEIGG